MTDQKSISGRAWAEMLLLGAIWGGSFFFAEIALREVPPLTITLHRVVWALPLLILLSSWCVCGASASRAAPASGARIW
jgi:EamA domain-containing membrane protein RarD